MYVVDDGVQGSHVDFGGRVVPGYTVKAAPVVAYTRHCPCHPPTTATPRDSPSIHPTHPVPTTTDHPLPSAVAPPRRPTSAPSAPRAKLSTAYSPPTALGAAGTAPTSHRRRPKHGVAKEVTIVTAFSCFKLECLDGSFRCGSGADITANLWSAPRPHTCATHRRRPRPRASPPPAPPAARAAPLPPTVYHPYPSRPRSHRRSPAPTAAPPSLLQVGADRLRSAPQCALRNKPGYTQRRHSSRHLASHLGLPHAVRGRHRREAQGSL